MSVMIPVQALAKLCHPLREAPWSGGAVTAKMVMDCISSGDFEIAPIGPSSPSDRHAARIAFLAKHGWNDPIQIDVGVPSLRCHVDWPVLDGNHRFAAAIVRGDAEICADISGSTGYAAEVFGIDENDI